MRFIDTSTYIPPVTWAATVATAVATKTAANTFPDIWKQLLPSLNSLVRSDRQIKCWYSEIIILGTEADVDHFRPKSNVKALSNKFADLDASVWTEIDVNTRVGYDFLAFEWLNFRVSCKHSNQGRVDGAQTKGKQDFFPLKNGSPTATSIANLINEQIGLLDPCNATDPELIKFSADGNVDAAYPAGTWEHCRAKLSIEIYHLNFDLKGMNDARLEKWNECHREILHLIQLYATKDTSLITGQIAKIWGLAKKSSQFSAVVIDCIRHYSSQQEYFYIVPMAKKLKK